MAKKLANRSKQSAPEILPEEQRWTVIDANSKRRIYLDSVGGIDRPEAERLSERLAADTEVVPQGALDRFGRYDPELLEDALQRIAAAEEE